MGERVPYRKLAGHRRGFLRGSSLWLGPDHLLAVSSTRFREEYKRYYFSDIQAIVIAEKPRFHISTRAAVIGYFWLVFFFLSFSFQSQSGTAVIGGIGIALALAWLYISATWSCTCRIHTAVSQDTLPSVYRTWTARKFLRVVDAEISSVQGVLEQPLSDAAPIGPPIAAPASFPAMPAESQPEPRVRSFSFHLLLAVLGAGALWGWFRLDHTPPGTLLISNSLAVLEIAAAILVVVQYHRKRVRPAQQKLAIATLVGMGVVFYGTIVGAGTLTALRTADTARPIDTGPALRVIAKIDLGANLALALAGLAILLLDRPADPEQASIVS